jgi:hypothetical protein
VCPLVQESQLEAWQEYSVARAPTRLAENRAISLFGSARATASGDYSSLQATDYAAGSTTPMVLELRAPPHRWYLIWFLASDKSQTEQPWSSTPPINQVDHAFPFSRFDDGNSVSFSMQDSDVQLRCRADLAYVCLICTCPSTCMNQPLRWYRTLNPVLWLNQPCCETLA